MSPFYFDSTRNENRQNRWWENKFFKDASPHVFSLILMGNLKSLRFFWMELVMKYFYAIQVFQTAGETTKLYNISVATEKKRKKSREEFLFCLLTWFAPFKIKLRSTPQKLSPKMSI